MGVGKLTYVSVQQSYQAVDPDDGYLLTANCPQGQNPLGGGVKLLSPNLDQSDYFLVQDYPSPTGWTARFFAGSPSQADVVQVTAICGVSQLVNGSPPSA